SELDIREHRHAGLTKNARVCLHAEHSSTRRVLRLLTKR
ncbi:hypothetical protein ACUXOD_002885, partial [Bacillus sp. 153480037-1]